MRLPTSRRTSAIQIERYNDPVTKVVTYVGCSTKIRPFLDRLETLLFLHNVKTTPFLYQAGEMSKIGRIGRINRIKVDNRANLHRYQVRKLNVIKSQRDSNETCARFIAIEVTQPRFEYPSSQSRSVPTRHRHLCLWQCFAIILKHPIND